MAGPVVASMMSAIHILAFGLGFYGVLGRARALSRSDVTSALKADNLWGVAALLWITSGLVRLFLTEKGAAWYVLNPFFHLKMVLFGVVGLVEVFPMLRLMGWRWAKQRGEEPNLDRIGLLAWISWAELAVVGVLPFVAALMARGVRL